MLFLLQVSKVYLQIPPLLLVAFLPPLDNVLLLPHNEHVLHLMLLNNLLVHLGYAGSVPIAPMMPATSSLAP